MLGHCGPEDLCLLRVCPFPRPLRERGKWKYAFAFYRVACVRKLFALSEPSNKVSCAFRNGRRGGGRLVLRFRWREIRLGRRLEALIGVALVDLFLSEVAAEFASLLFDLVPDDVVHLIRNEVVGVIAGERWHTN